MQRSNHHPMSTKIIVKKKVIVIGGGIAGLAAATSLSERNFEVTLLERRTVLGGRASSYLYPEGAEWIDNCQHILLGCCTNLMHFYQKNEVLDQVSLTPKITFLTNSGSFELKASPLPAPLHLLPSLLTMPELRIKDKFLLLRALIRIFFMNERDVHSADGFSIGQWLKKYHQSDNCIKLFWVPVLISSLNETLDRASAKYAFKTIREVFLKNRRGFHMGIPNISLSDLYSTPSIKKIESHGGRVLLSHQVQKILIDNDQIQGIVTLNNLTFKGDYYIFALPIHRLQTLLPQKWIEKNLQLSKFKTSPITGIHLWFDRKITSLPFAALPGRDIQWFFLKNNAEEQYLSCVISASYDFLQKGKKELVELALKDLEAVFPHIKKAKLVKSIVIKERHATFSPSPKVDDFRPLAQTSMPNLFLAGDWTKTDWPSTMEGAVRSGYMAAEAVQYAQGCSQKIVLDDLAPEGFGKWFRRFI